MINKVTLVGRLGKDPETKVFENESQVTQFSLATDDSYFDKVKNERVNQTEWHNVVLWGGLSKVADQYLKKGALVYIEGKITTRNYEDKDGIKRYTTEIVGRTLKMLEKKESGSSFAPPPSAVDAPPASQPNNDDIPF